MVNRLATAQSTAAICHWRPAAIVTLATVAALTALTADAAPKQARPAQPQEATAPRDAGEPIMAIVSIKSQQVVFYDADGWILRAPVSTGTEGRETPAGVFAVVDKEVDHRSNMYDDAWMPHMQRITWNGIALHGGPLPGYAASHGCVRMPFGFANKLFNKTRIGMWVIIAPDDPNPGRFFPSGASRPRRRKPSRLRWRGPRRSPARPRRPQGRPTRQSKLPRRAARETASLTASLRKLNRSRPAPMPNSRPPTRRSRPQKRTRRRSGPRTRRQKAASGVEEAGKQLDTALADMRKSKPDAAALVKNAVKTAETRKAATAKAALDANSRSSRSRSTSAAPRRSFTCGATRTNRAGRGRGVRSRPRGPGHDPNPDKPIGTHVFTAMARNDAGLRWTAVTIDNGDEAKNALDRITIPQDVLDPIAQTTLPRSSIIVSDEPLSSETNYRTEFVAVLSNQPQGGFITRQPTNDGNFASDDGFFISRGNWDNTPRRGDYQRDYYNRRALPNPFFMFGRKVLE